MSCLLEENIIKSKDICFNDNIGGIGNVFFKYMKKYSNNIAQIQAETDEYDTYDTLLKKCVCTAIVLKNKGIHKGDLVCLCSEMHLDSCALLIAAYFIGAVTYCLEPTLPVSESADIVKLLPPKIIFVSMVAEELIRDVLEKSQVSAEYVIFESQFKNEYLFKRSSDVINNFEPEYIKDSTETHCIYFSSGSTGQPKAILLNHYYTYLTAQPITGCWERNGLNLGGIENPVVLCYSNWHWVSSINILVLGITTGACRILCKSFDGQEAWNILEKYKVTNTFLSPYQCIELHFNKPKNPSLPYLKELVTGGSKLSKEYVILLNKFLGPAIVRAEYGLTEVGYMTAFNRTKNLHRKLSIECPESVGCPVDGVWYKILDSVTGKPLGPNQPGELRLKLTNTKGYMNGYYKRDSSECFDEDGWFKTEDIAYYDDNLCFHIVDRFKARIIYKDWLIYPSRIEQILLQHPSVKNAVVIGIPHREDGERLMGVVVLNENSKKIECTTPNVNKYLDVIANDLQQFVDNKVEYYQKLREGVKILKDFPLTVSGKINRLKIKQLILEN